MSREPSRKIGLIILGLLMWSVAMRDVSDVPGGWTFNISQKRPPSLTLLANVRPSRIYWLPIADARFSQRGLAGSAGGFSGLKAMWQDPQETPIR